MTQPVRNIDRYMVELLDVETQLYRTLGALGGHGAGSTTPMIARLSAVRDISASHVRALISHCRLPHRPHGMATILRRTVDLISGSYGPESDSLFSMRAPDYRRGHSLMALALVGYQLLEQAALDLKSGPTAAMADSHGMHYAAALADVQQFVQCDMSRIILRTPAPVNDVVLKMLTERFDALGRERHADGLIAGTR